MNILDVWVSANVLAIILFTNVLSPLKTQKPHIWKEIQVHYTYVFGGQKDMCQKEYLELTIIMLTVSPSNAKKATKIAFQIELLTRKFLQKDLQINHVPF